MENLEWVIRAELGIGKWCLERERGATALSSKVGGSVLRVRPAKKGGYWVCRVV